MTGRGPAKRGFVVVTAKLLGGFSSGRHAARYVLEGYWDGACGVDSERPNADPPVLRACIFLSTRLHTNRGQHRYISKVWRQ